MSLHLPADAHFVTFPKSFIIFTRLCEAYCVGGCCGLEAFSFDDSTLTFAIQHTGIDATLAMCDEAFQAADIFRSEPRQCWSEQDEFNTIWENGEVLYHWLTAIIADTRRIVQLLKDEVNT